ncbi:hypothetical protein [uncultured Methanospirillum sp.]|uniref:hypothetical protein n=1 Tax=uncultured Methanospirillum sp. TaxID=262503 RepID=UPI0029C60BA7|nr:hypothetical protein [uncultured Methanospirillum sp.]
MKVARHPSLAELLPVYFSIFSVAAQISAMSGEEQTRMFCTIEKRLAPWLEDGGLAVPTENCILTAVNR